MRAKVSLMPSLIFMRLDCGVNMWILQPAPLIVKSMVIKHQKPRWSQCPTFLVTLQLFYFGVSILLDLLCSLVPSFCMFFFSSFLPPLLYFSSLNFCLFSHFFSPFPLSLISFSLPFFLLSPHLFLSFLPLCSPSSSTPMTSFLFLFHSILSYRSALFNSLSVCNPSPPPPPPLLHWV